ncbi:MAG: UDP-glucose/GDP-mannose dehydrogenase family protein [Kofleriaceae bacterium]|nr:UDP-glucose/GDP-mannose dehydrogenase family protein [Kofleriaceae bacterium]MCL4224290.1 UDP-glucose/GDP-mannose dehydrogenase family protein [Myxococcales bacterium]
MRLAVIGTGYVGLVAGAGFSDFGNDVVCVDLDAARVERMRRGEIPIFEPRLEELVKRNLAAGRLSFTTRTAEAVPGADVVILAVGTPQGEHDGAADMRYIDEAAREVGRALDGFAVIVTKSTVPVGTADRIRALVAAETAHPFAVASNPEFLKEGDAVNDFMKPDRVILGVDDERAARVLRNLYTPFVRINDRIMVMDIRSAELTKYAANSMLAVRISFMNELALLAERVGADIEKVRKGIGSDPRIGPKFLFPGPGFGGSCFPKDIRALAHTARQHGATVEVVEAAERANNRQKRVLAERIKARFGGALAGKRIAVWGLAFKPETDDIREAPALTLIAELIEAGATVVGYDPAAMEPVRALGLALELAPDMYAAAEGAHALALVTEWKQFRGADLRRLRAAMAEPNLFDGRNIWDPEQVREHGFHYTAIGRGTLPR